MIRALIWLCLLSGTVAAGYFGYGRMTRLVPLTITTTEVTRGPMALTVSATGTIQPPATVTVGCEISGKIKELLVDFNDRVTAGKVIARIDPELLEVEAQQAKADVAAADANIQVAEVKLANATWELDWTKKTSQSNASSEKELASSQSWHDAAEAEVTLAKAQLERAKSVENLAKAMLARAVITSPIDGVVLTREVDVGQTVVAALQTPILYTLARDLTRMTVHAHVSEADIGGVRDGQPVTFTVDAYPQRTFDGSVRQVRHAATVIENVVTYDVVIDAPNSEYLLKPGMTASVTIEVLRRDETLRIDNIALRFRPPLVPEIISGLLDGLEWPERPSAIAEQTRRQKGVTTRATATGPASEDIAPPEKTVLWRSVDETWQAVPVWTGIAAEQHTEILCGADAGDRIVTEAVRPKGRSGLTDALRLAQPGNRRL